MLGNVTEFSICSETAERYMNEISLLSARLFGALGMQ
jgi:hypothetical protein